MLRKPRGTDCTPLAGLTGRERDSVHDHGLSVDRRGLGHPSLCVQAFVTCLLATSAVIACTLGAFGPSATSDGRTILWKNRDNDCPDQEMAYHTGPRFRFVTDINTGDTSNAWAGINEAGFAIIDANSFNLGGDDVDDDDGTIMFAALGTCATVDDFARMMDSLNRVGRISPENYGVFDSTGMTSIFEAGDTFYTRFNADDDTLGLLLRANYSMSGGSANQLGRNRWRRAMQLTVPARRADSIDARFIIQTLARDLGQVGFDPYPLPFEDSLGNLPRGFLPTDSTICRYRTRSVQVIVGPRPGAAPGQAMMWILLGPAEVALPIPVWVIADSMPEPLNGPDHAALCDKALSVHECLHPDLSHINAVNTFRLSEMYDSFAPVQSAIFALVDSCESVWGPNGPDPAQACSVTTTACRMVMQAYRSFEHYTHWGATPKAPGPSGPNPTAQSADRVAISPAVSSKAERAWVFDAAGRRVAQARIKPDGAVTTPTPIGLRSGAYFLVFPPGTDLKPVRFTLAR
jgi:hypothetical protein